MTEHLSVPKCAGICFTVMNHGQLHLLKQHKHTHNRKSGQTCVSQHPFLQNWTGTLWSLGRVSMWRVKVGSKKPSWVQVQAWATLTLSPGSPPVPGGPVGPAGPVSPCGGNIQNTQKTEHPKGKPYFFIKNSQQHSVCMYLLYCLQQRSC